MDESDLKYEIKRLTAKNDVLERENKSLKEELDISSSCSSSGGISEAYGSELQKLTQSLKDRNQLVSVLRQKLELVKVHPSPYPPITPILPY